MKWINTAFQFKNIAELCRKEMTEAGLKTDLFFNDEKWYVAWMPMSKSDYETGVKILCNHIW